MTAGHYTLTEILSQPDAWRATLEIIRSQADMLRAFFQADHYDSLVFTGCGSSHYLSLSTSALYRRLTNKPGYAFPASELWLYPEAAVGARSLLITSSRSGETTETLKACKAFKQRGGDVLTLSAYPERTMASVGTINLILTSAQEESVAQTRAFTSLYLAEVAVLALFTGNDGLLDELSRLPDLCQRLINTYRPLIEELGRNQALDQFFFLGSGMLHGIACELSLKMKEMSLSHSEPFHTLEFRHGPRAMITPATLIVGLLSGTNDAYELAVLNEMKDQGAQVLAIGEKNADVNLESGLSELARCALYLPLGQLLALTRALSKGLDPDRPANLEAFVTLKEHRNA